MELVADTYHHTTLCCTIKFGNSERCHLRSLGKLLRLLKGVLSCRAIKHEHHLVWRIGYYLRHNVADFGKLLHKSNLVVKAASGVDKHYISTICHCRA